MSDRYILNAALEPQVCVDLLQWARWLEGHAEAIVVAHTIFTLPAGLPPATWTSPRLPGLLGDVVEMHEHASRMIHRPPEGNLVFVSTRFIGLDQRILPMPGTPPLLFETRVFGGPLQGEQDRYATRAEAVAGHEAICARIRPFVGQAPAP